MDELITALENYLAGPPESMQALARVTFAFNVDLPSVPEVSRAEELAFRRIW